MRLKRAHVRVCVWLFSYFYTWDCSIIDQTRRANKLPLATQSAYKPGPSLSTQPISLFIRQLATLCCHPSIHSSVHLFNWQLVKRLVALVTRWSSKNYFNWIVMYVRPSDRRLSTTHTFQPSMQPVGLIMILLPVIFYCCWSAELPSVVMIHA